MSLISEAYDDLKVSFETLRTRFYRLSQSHELVTTDYSLLIKKHERLQGRCDRQKSTIKKLRNNIRTIDQANSQDIKNQTKHLENKNKELVRSNTKNIQKIRDLEARLRSYERGSISEMV